MLYVLYAPLCINTVLKEPYCITCLSATFKMMSVTCHDLASFLRVQSQVDEVIDVMQENISKVIERGERLDDLQDKSGEVASPMACLTGDMLPEIHSAALRKWQNTAQQTHTVGD